MRFTFALFLSLLFFSRSILAQEFDCKIASAAISEASKIRGLKIKRQVPCYVHGKEEVKKFLYDSVEKQLPPKRLKMEELVYRTLGFIPDDFDYKKGMIDLYLSQIGGYYDPEKKHYIMAAWIPAMMQAPVAAHELTHALQDQYYDLKNFMDSEKEPSDILLARSALVEGDATAVMLDYSRATVGQPSIAKDESVGNVMMQNVMGVAMVAASQNIPQSLQVTLIFPYTSGLMFAHNLLKRSGYKGVDQAFKHPPRSTEEIMHIEKYFLDKPDFIQFSDADYRVGDAGVNSKIVYSDTLGEFGVSALLNMFINDKREVAEVAAGWGGDRLNVFEDAGDPHRIISWRTNWDSIKDADQFLKSYSDALQAKYGLPTPPRPGAGWIYSSAGKEVQVIREGTQVTILFRIA